jgi:hypothetical protein
MSAQMKTVPRAGVIWPEHGGDFASLYKNPMLETLYTEEHSGWRFSVTLKPLELSAFEADEEIKATMAADKVDAARAAYRRGDFIWAEPVAEVWRASIQFVELTGGGVIFDTIIYEGANSHIKEVVEKLLKQVADSANRKLKALAKDVGFDEMLRLAHLP